ncbi:MAG: glycyl-radical enzyme activating protein [Flexilinea sp.]
MDTYVLNTQRFSTKDGPGIRTTFFLQGCNLRCAWCHNPESNAFTPQLQFFNEKCQQCRVCAKVCKRHVHIFTENHTHEMNPDLCIRCGECVLYCPTEALRLGVKKYNTHELVKIALKDEQYFSNSGGGVTLSGGEPMIQPDFVLDFFRELRKHNIHTALDTAACVSYKEFEKVIPFTDLFLVDLKTMDSEIHKKYTGVGNELILNNIKTLSKDGAKIMIRMPIIKGVNDSVENARQAANFLSGLSNILEIRLMPYHTYGIEKGKSIGIEMTEFEAPDNLQEIIAQYHLFDLSVEI